MSGDEGLRRLWLRGPQGHRSLFSFDEVAIAAGGCQRLHCATVRAEPSSTVPDKSAIADGGAAIEVSPCDLPHVPVRLFRLSHATFYVFHFRPEPRPSIARRGLHTNEHKICGSYGPLP